MITATFSTTGFIGDGAGINCRPCGRQIWFPENCSVFLFTFDDVQVISDASTRVVLHDCRQPKEFYCPNCELFNAEKYNRSPRRSLRWKTQPTCPHCATVLAQRDVPSVEEEQPQ